MVAAYAAEGDSFRAEKPRLWSPGRVPAAGRRFRTFDLHPDGQRVAVLKPRTRWPMPSVDQVVLIQNFFDELRRVAPPRPRGRATSLGCDSVRTISS